MDEPPVPPAEPRITPCPSVVRPAPPSSWDLPPFSGLIVSRPSPILRALTRARALVVALSLHATAAAILLLAPLVVLEAMHPMDARPDDVIPIFQPRSPGPQPGGDALPAPLIRKGGGSVSRPREPRPVAAIPPPELRQPDAITAPASNPTPVPDDGSNDADSGQRPLGTTPGPGDPEGQGTADHGSKPGCEGCIGDGPAGPGGGHDSSAGPFQSGDPRVTQPIIIPSSRVLPRYPDLARRAGLEGTVILMIVIGSDGKVGEIEVLRSPDQRWGFDLAAIEAVKQWRYQPGLMAGRPVSVYAQVMVEFTISR
jgi:periplasmic protein TonB